MAAIESEIYFRVLLWWWHSVGKMDIYWCNKVRWDISIHGWDKSTSDFGKQTAAILEFYFRFLFSLNFRTRRVILHWSTKFRQNRSALGGVMTSYRFFQMAAVSHIGFDLDNIRPPTKCNCWSEVGPQIRSCSDLQFRRYCYFYIMPLWFKIAYSHPFWGVLAYFTQMTSSTVLTPKGISCRGSTSFEP